MPTPLAETIAISFGAQEPWPADVRLYQPYEVEQILLPDSANSLAVQAFLKMCGLPFEVEMRWNAEFMSPSGRVPFLRCGAFVVAELEPIAQFCGAKDISLTARLSSEERADMRAYMSLINTVLLNAELYVCWLENETWSRVTRARAGAVFAWPLGWLQARAARSRAARRLKALGWADKSLDQVLADVDACCSSLSQRLGDRSYFFDTGPTQLDALVCGHARAMRAHASGSRALSRLAHALAGHPRLLRLAARLPASATPRPVPRPVRSCLAHLVLSLQNLNKSSVEESPNIPKHPDRLSNLQNGNESKAKIISKICFRKKLFDEGDVFGFKPFAAKEVLVMHTDPDKASSDTARNTSAPQDIKRNFTPLLINSTASGDIHGNTVKKNITYTHFHRACPETTDKEIINTSGGPPRDIESEVSDDNTISDCTVIDITSIPLESKNTATDQNTTNGVTEPSEEHSLDVFHSTENCPNEVEDNLQSMEFDSVSFENCEKLLGNRNNYNLDENKVNPTYGDLNVDNQLKEVDSSKTVSRSNSCCSYESCLISEHFNELDSTENRATELDALVFGHVFAIITTQLPCSALAATVRAHASLVQHARRIDQLYFKRP